MLNKEETAIQFQNSPKELQDTIFIYAGDNTGTRYSIKKNLNEQNLLHMSRAFYF